MAVVNIGQIKTTLNKSVKYVANPDKTRDYAFTSSNCANPSNPDQVTAAFEDLQALARTQVTQGKPGTIKAHHIMQSFAPGEVDPVTAHNLGVELIEQITSGEYQYYVTTHLDKGHVHNHILFNPVNIHDLRRFRMVKTSLRDIRSMSDTLCRKHGLSVIAPAPHNKQILRDNPYMLAKGQSHAERLRVSIDEAISHTTSFPELKASLADMGIEIRTQRSAITYKHTATMQRPIRGHRLGPGYTEEALIARMGQAQHTQIVMNYQHVKIINEEAAYIRIPHHTTPGARLVVSPNNMIRHDKSWHIYLPKNRPSTIVDENGNYLENLNPDQIYHYYAKPNPAHNLPFAQARPPRVERGRTAGERRYFHVIDVKVERLHEEMRNLKAQQRWNTLTPQEQAAQATILSSELTQTRSEIIDLIIERDKLTEQIEPNQQSLDTLNERIDTLLESANQTRRELNLQPHQKASTKKRKGPRL